MDSLSNIGPLVCRRFGISLQDLVDVWKEYNRLVGLMYMATQLPQIMADVTNNAKNRDVVCPRCDGLKKVRDREAKSRICPVCKGEGRVTVPGDPHAIELVFEVLRVIGRKAPAIRIEQNDRVESMEELLRMTQKIVMREPPADTTDPR